MQFRAAPNAPTAGVLPGSGLAGDILAYNNSLYCYLNGAWVALNNNTTAIADVTGLTSALAGKEPTISAGSNTQYWRGDKTWQTLSPSAITTVASGTVFYRKTTGTGGAETQTLATLKADLAIPGIIPTAVGPSGEVITGGPPARQYWRILVTGTNGGSNLTVSELQFREVVGTPQTPSGGAALSSTSYSVGPSTAFDGNNGTDWSANWGPTPGNPAWLGYNYGTGLNKTINQVAITNSSTGFWSTQSPTAFSVQFSADGSTWSTQFTVSGITWSGASQTQVFTDPNAGGATTTTEYYPTKLPALNDIALATLADGQVLTYVASAGTWQNKTPTTGTVTSVSVATANGVSGTVASPGTTPAITLSLGAITPSSVASSGSVTGSNLSGTNTGDQTITLTGDVTGSGTGSFAATIGANRVTFSKLVAATQTAFVGATAVGNFGEITPSAATALLTNFAYNAGGAGTKGLVPATAVGDNTKFLRGDGTFAAVDLSGTNVTGTLAGARLPALTGDVSMAAGTTTLSIGTNKVTDAMLAQIATGSFKGRTSAGTGNVEALTGTQATAMLDTFGTSTKGLVPAPTTVAGKVLSDNGAWVSVAPAVSNWTPVTATGTGSSQTITLPENNLSVNDVIVTVEGLIQNPTLDYTITGTTLTITAPNTADIVVRKMNASTSSGGGASAPTLYPQTSPSDAIFSWVNQGTTTKTVNSNGSISTIFPQAGSINIRGRVTPVPGSAWTLEIGLIHSIGFWNYTAQQVGVLLQDSVSGKLMAFGQYNDSGASYLIGSFYTNVTTVNSNWTTSHAHYGSFSPMFIKVVNDGTTISFYISRDGYSYILWTTAGNGFWIVPTHIGWFGFESGNALPVSVTCFHWKLTTP